MSKTKKCKQIQLQTKFCLPNSKIYLFSLKDIQCLKITEHLKLINSLCLKCQNNTLL